MHSFSTFSTPELRLRCCPTTKIDLWDSSSSLTIFVHLPKLNPDQHEQLFGEGIFSSCNYSCSCSSKLQDREKIRPKGLLYTVIRRKSLRPLVIIYLKHQLAYHVPPTSMIPCHIFYFFYVLLLTRDPLTLTYSRDSMLPSLVICVFINFYLILYTNLVIGQNDLFCDFFYKVGLFFAILRVKL